jgi:acyl-homoserine-lactone acylase
MTDRPALQRSRRRGMLPLLLLLATACTHQGRPDGAGADSYEVTIRRDGHGVPHIVAADFGSLGYGEGYAFAQDHACTLADLVVRARGERARYFGRGERDAHLNSDVANRALDAMDGARRVFESAPAEMRAWIGGYAAGYNRYLADTPVERIPGWCRGQPWVRSITAVEVVARGAGPPFVTEIATAAPPGATPRGATTAPPVAEAAESEPVTTASNAWALGAERSAGGRGMLLANPRWFWTCGNRTGR